MCLAFPAKVKKIIGYEAIVQYQNEERTVLVGEESVKEGDFVMIQMGIIVKVISAKEAKETLAVFNKIAGK